MPFATTKRLDLRAVRESDKPLFIALGDDYRVSSSSWGDHVVPKGEQGWRKTEGYVEKSLMAIVIEVKREYAHLRNRDADEQTPHEEAVEAGKEKTQEEWDREQFAGYIMLHTQGSKNRDALVMMALVVPWWGNGLATEALGWVVQHTFEQLGMHRMGLGVFEGNGAAKRVYEKCGFVEEGRHRKAVWRDGHWEDMIMMSILDEEYWERKRQQA